MEEGGMDNLAPLIADGVRYFHQSDETMFFAWLDRMAVVSGYEGHGDGLHIHLVRHPTDEDLRELIAFHERYDIDMRQLAAFKTSVNAPWFADPCMFWHDKVFGSAAS